MALPASGQQAQAAPPPLQFEELNYNFESVVQGEIVSHIFNFRNVGDRSVKLENVITSCGCTASEWPVDPILPGAEGSLRVVFDSENKMGDQKKIITVITKSPAHRIELSIKAYVLPRRSQF